MSDKPSSTGSARNRSESGATLPDRAIYELINEGARLLAAGRAQEAIPILQRAVELDPDNISAALNLGGAYVLAGKHRLAVPILERACELEPENVMAWTNLGAAYLDRPPFSTTEGEEKAILAFERAIQIAPFAPNLSYNLGLIRKDRQEWELALKHFQDAIVADPDDKDARYWCQVLVAQIEKQSRDEGQDPRWEDNVSGI